MGYNSEDILNSDTPIHLLKDDEWHEWMRRNETKNNKNPKNLQIN